MRWLLPEHIDDILPEEAGRIEVLRRGILDLFFESRYELVMPPPVEFTDSLLTGTGHDLDLRTFKLVDQLSGKMMGVRADITPQVARIDAHLLNHKGVTRLCYCGSVLHARPQTPAASREPIQIGAELFGQSGIAGDLEVQLFEALQRKDTPALKSLAKRLDAKTRAALLLLPELYGDKDILDLAE